MPIETQNIIIGALIGFIPSILLAYFSYRYQINQKKLEREWSLEDKKKEAIRQLRDSRLNHIENVASNYYNWFSKVEFQLDKVYKTEQIFNEFIEQLDEKANSDSSEVQPFVYGNELIETKIVELVSYTHEVITLLRDIREEYDKQFDVPRNPGKLTIIEVHKNPNLVDDYFAIKMKATESYTQLIRLIDRERLRNIELY